MKTEIDNYLINMLKKELPPTSVPKSKGEWTALINELLEEKICDDFQIYGCEAVMKAKRRRR